MNKIKFRCFSKKREEIIKKEKQNKINKILKKISKIKCIKEQINKVKEKQNKEIERKKREEEIAIAKEELQSVELIVEETYSVKGMIKYGTLYCVYKVYDFITDLF